MPILHAIFLGLVQAATEFLPVSSTAHLLVFGELLGHDIHDPYFRAFSVIVQLGTLLAVVIYFRADLRRMVTEDRRLAVYLAIGTIPAVVLDLLFEKAIEERLGNYAIAASLI